MKILSEPQKPRTDALNDSALGQMMVDKGSIQSNCDNVNVIELSKVDDNIYISSKY